MKKNIINRLIILTGLIMFYSCLSNADEAAPSNEQATQEQVQTVQNEQTVQPNADGPRPGRLLDKALENHPEEQAKLDLNQDGIVDQNERMAARQTLRQNAPPLPNLPSGNAVGKAPKFMNRPRPIAGQGPLANIQNSTPAQHQGVSKDPNSDS